MNKETLALLSALFCLSDATEQDITAALTALAKDKGNSPVALSQVYTQLAEKEQKMAALSAQATQVNSAQYVPIDQVVALQQEITQLRSAVEGDKREGLIQAALTNGKLSPALVDWARKLSVADLTGFLDKATPVAALGGNPQAKGTPDQTVVALSAAEEAAVKMLGMTNEDYIAQNKEQK